MTVPLAMIKEVLEAKGEEEEKGAEKGMMSSWAACLGWDEGVRMGKSGS